MPELFFLRTVFMSKRWSLRYCRQGTASRLRDFCSDVRWDVSSNTIGNWLFRSLDVLICRPISFVIRRPTLWALGRVFRGPKNDESLMSLKNSSADIIVIGDLVQVRYAWLGCRFGFSKYEACVTRVPTWTSSRTWVRIFDDLDSDLNDEELDVDELTCYLRNWIQVEQVQNCI